MKRRMFSGSDPNFPYLSEYDRYKFPIPETCPDDIIAIGGNLSPGMLLSAYEQGLFPWYNPEDPLLWQSPNPRMVLLPENLHISSSMKKVFKKGKFRFVLDCDFSSVIKNCAEIFRPDQDGTWITEDIITAYTEMHRLGWAHSAETYQDGELVGGLYGIRLGKAFFGESMFSKKPNASKFAFLNLAKILFADDIAFIDCQAYTDHLASLGAREISRNDFLCLLRKNLSPRLYKTSYPEEDVDVMDRRGNWGLLYEL